MATTISKQEALKLIEQEMKDLKKLNSNYMKEHKKFEDFFLTSVENVLKSSNLEAELNSGKIDINSLKGIATKVDVLKENVVKSVLKANKAFMTEFKSNAKELGYIAEGLLNEVTRDASFGFGKESKEYWMNRLSSSELKYEIKDKYKFSPKDKAKVSAIVKSLMGSPVGLSHEEYIDTFAKTQIFIDTFTSIKEKVYNIKDFKKNDAKWLENNPRESSILDDLVANFDNKMMLEGIDKLSSIKQKDLDAVKSEFDMNVAPDELLRAKRALIAVKACLNYFVGELSPSSKDDYDLTLMYLNDARDHLKLSKSCYENNYQAMIDDSSMDTASRDLIDDKLWEYLRSDELFDLRDEEKKNKRKNKIK